MRTKYEAPKLERLGTFRDLTQVGGVGPCTDGLSVNGSPDFACARS